MNWTGHRTDYRALSWLARKADDSRRFSGLHNEKVYTKMQARWSLEW